MNEKKHLRRTILAEVEFKKMKLEHEIHMLKFHVPAPPVPEAQQPGDGDVQHLADPSEAGTLVQQTAAAANAIDVVVSCEEGPEQRPDKTEEAIISQVHPSVKVEEMGVAASAEVPVNATVNPQDVMAMDTAA
jgi:hypothetical protein